MEFKGTRLEKLSIFFSIYLLLAISVSLSVAADETKPFSGSITIRDVNNPWGMEVILDKYSQDALTVMEIDVMSCEMEMTCGQADCEIPYSVVVDGEGIPTDEAGNERIVLSLCEHINDYGERITFVFDLNRWTTVAVKSISDTKLEYYLMDQKTYSIIYTQMLGDVTVHTIQHAGRLRETIADVAHVDPALCSADLLSEARIEANEQIMETYAIAATNWYFANHPQDFKSASLEPYNSICSTGGGLINAFGNLMGIFSGKGSKYSGKSQQYDDKVQGLTQDAQELYNRVNAYAEAATKCTDAYQYVKELHDSVLGLIDEIKGYQRFLDNPLPACLDSLPDNINKLPDKLNGLIPDFIPEMENSLDISNGIYPDCIQNFLGKTGEFQNLLDRFKIASPDYCGKVQKMKQYYEGEGDAEMADKYADLYLPCEDGSRAGLSFDGISLADCVDLEVLTTTGIMLDECTALSAKGISGRFKDFIPDMSELPDACTDYNSALSDLIVCDGIDLDSYRDKYPDAVGTESEDLYCTGYPAELKQIAQAAASCWDADGDTHHCEWISTTGWESELQVTEE
ncbi:MAG: hypothetical protein KJ928_00075, partial [Candidatus Altiarchaeota archaeon]|nr:hypothetical protein [Candidatus Altiarchaeota archaeon]